MKKLRGQGVGHVTCEVIRSYGRTWGGEAGTNSITGWLVDDRDQEWSCQLRQKHHGAGILIGVEKKSSGSGMGSEEMDSSSLSRTGEDLGLNPTYKLPSQADTGSWVLEET